MRLPPVEVEVEACRERADVAKGRRWERAWV